MCVVRVCVCIWVTKCTRSSEVLRLLARKLREEKGTMYGILNKSRLITASSLLHNYVTKSESIVYL